MKTRQLSLVVAGFFLAAFFSLSPLSMGEAPKIFVPDKALCAKMLRFGRQAYQRGKYLDAKEYFRKAIQADPHSTAAWSYYDVVTIFALAEKVEKDPHLIAPDVSARGETGSSKAVSPPPAPPETTPPPKTEFKIVDDEGC
ncbi:MAG: hypothetical protein GY849_01510 [Deltaproteobacteria bacterium]|nr:hypothetical protein [Deltaproteobacteria bacterium]